MGDTIAIEKLKSSIIINNKGELLFPEKDFGKRSEVRNRLLADLLLRTEFMEKAGTGIQRINDACKANGNNCIFDFTDAFWITIETNRNEPLNEPLNERNVQMIELIRKNKNITVEELAINMNASKATIKRDIVKLKELKVLKRTGSKKTGYGEITKHE